MTRTDPTDAPRQGFPLRRLLLAVAASFIILAMGCASFFVCLPAWLRFGIVVESCPAGRPVPTAWINADGLRRGVWRDVLVGEMAHYTVNRADDDRTAEVRAPDVSLSLVKPDGEILALSPRKSWQRGYGSARRAGIMLPADLPDGDYILRADTHARLGDASVDAPLPLYAPARVHLLTDRPLYEPGNTILIRALVLRAADLTPLAKRPGIFVVTDPDGTVLLEERATADDWGIVSGSFPLDEQASSGDWQIRWDSGDDSGTTTVRVEPFTLPRFRVEATADRPWYGPGDRPVVSGQVVYASGAPVPGAVLSMNWRTSGAWPPPTGWTDGSPGGLPTTASADDNGAFSLKLPVVPADLLGQAKLSTTLDAMDPAGDRVRGRLQLLLSQDRIQVQAVTELGDGLVEGFNNRVYLRATTPDGQPLRQVALSVSRAWDPGDPGITAATDVDGVAALQIDPGPAVNVLVPALPVRPPPRVQALGSPSVTDLLDGHTVDLADQRSLDAWSDDLQGCARFSTASQGRAGLVLRASPGGEIQPFAADDDVARCIARILLRRRLPPGSPRLLKASWTVVDPDIPHLSMTSRGWPAVPPTLQTQLDRAARDARSCLPEDLGSAPLPRRLEWRLSAGKRTVQNQWLSRARSPLSDAVVACVQSRIQGLSLDRPAAKDAVGVVDLSVVQANRFSTQAPQPTTMLGYELTVVAKAGSEDLGHTTLRLSPGTIPAVRLRANPVLPERGQAVAIELLRGPDFSGELPEKLVMTHQSGKTLVAKLDPDSRTASFDLPDDLDGWFSVNWSGATARVFVRAQGQLDLSVTSARERYAPGDRATLSISTSHAGQGGPAAVGLIGVDASLGQLVTLPGPDSLESLRDPVQTDDPAFGILDGQALSLGRVRGDNAAAATVLRVSAIPDPQDTDRDVRVQSVDSFDPLLVLSDHFYSALAELHAQVQSWETTAPAGQQLDNAAMASLWAKAREACAQRGDPIIDAYGRPLRLA
ncbi:MAG: hypothetical protein GXP62_07065, partial [Oligoflexia bacterium]|nr:hypothetical protein [Oligoflexia bacterium]